MPPDLLPWVLVLGLLVYGLLGGLVARRLWPASRSPDRREDPAANAAYWFPGITAVLIYSWLGALIPAVCLLLFTPVLQGPALPSFLLGAGIGLGGFALLIRRPHSLGLPPSPAVASAQRRHPSEWSA